MFYTILEKSESVKKTKSFRTHKWKSSNNLADTLTETFWNIRTLQRRQTFIEYLKMKELLGLTNLVEKRCCYDVPGVLEDDLFIDALRAWKTDVPKNILWQRLQTLQRLLGKRQWNLNLYYTYDKEFSYEIEEVRRSIRKVKKYSGYVRNSSAVGSKRFSSTSRPDPEIFEWSLDEKIDYYNFLTVGDLTMSTLSVCSLPEDESKKIRNGEPRKYRVIRNSEIIEAYRAEGRSQSKV